MGPLVEHGAYPALPKHAGYAAYLKDKLITHDLPDQSYIVQCHVHVCTGRVTEFSGVRIQRFQ